MSTVDTELLAKAAEFSDLVERVRVYAALPCVCVPDPRGGATEESIQHCTPCHLRSTFDEALGHARDEAHYIEGMAERHPAQKPKARATRKSNVVRFHPMGTKPQPEAVWKD